MSKYTDAELKEKAWDVLAAYQMNDPRAEMLIGILASMTGTHPQYIFNELNKVADKKI